MFIFFFCRSVKWMQETGSKKCRYCLEKTSFLVTVLLSKGCQVQKRNPESWILLICASEIWEVRYGFGHRFDPSHISWHILIFMAFFIGIDNRDAILNTV